MSVRIYHNPKCSTSRKVLQALQDAGVDTQIVQYLKTPPSVSELRAILQRGDLTPQDVLRVRDKVYKEKFAGRSLTDEEWLEAIAENPSILERPLCVSDDHAAVCRPVERWREFT